MRPVHRLRWVIVVAALGACSDDASETATTATTTVTTTDPTVTTNPTTTTTTVIPATTTATTDAPTTSRSCPPGGDTATVEDGFPQRLSSMVGADLRLGAHECAERIVVELAGDGEVPGYRIGYEPDPIRLSPSDLTTDVAGDATLVLRLGAWMPTMEGEGYAGPTRFTPDEVAHLVEVVQIENFEGMTAWAVGVDRERPFTVTVLDDPVRIVVDVSTT